MALALHLLVHCLVRGRPARECRCRTTGPPPYARPTCCARPGSTHDGKLIIMLSSARTLRHSTRAPPPILLGTVFSLPHGVPLATACRKVRHVARCGEPRNRLSPAILAYIYICPPCHCVSAARGSRGRKSREEDTNASAPSEVNTATGRYSPTPPASNMLPSIENGFLGAALRNCGPRLPPRAAATPPCLVWSLEAVSQKRVGTEVGASWFAPPLA